MEKILSIVLKSVKDHTILVAKGITIGNNPNTSVGGQKLGLGPFYVYV